LNNVAYLWRKKLGGWTRPTRPQTKPASSTPPRPEHLRYFGLDDCRRHEYGRALLLLQESSARFHNQAEVQSHFAMAKYRMDQEQGARAGFQLPWKLNRIPER